MELAAAELKIIEQREDGSGVIEIPIMTEAAEVDFAKTAGGGKRGSIDAAMLSEIVANFEPFPGPVPLGAAGVDAEGHLDFNERGGPQLGFIEQVKVEGSQLWARMDLGPTLFGLVVGQRAFRGFSVELRRDLKLATVEFQGWALVGGMFTNRTALDVNFRIAAEGTLDSAETVFTSIRLEAGDKEKAMSQEAPTIALAFHEAKVTELTSKQDDTDRLLLAAREENDGLRSQVKELSDERQAIEAEKDGKSAAVIRLESTVKNLTSAKDDLLGKVEELSGKVEEAEKRNLGIEVRKTIEDAIGLGIPPAIFEGWEADPAAWLTSKYASLEALQGQVAVLAGTPLKVPIVNPKSGHDPSTAAKEADAKQVALTAEEQKQVKRFGKVDFAAATTEEEAREAWLASKDTK